MRGNKRALHLCRGMRKNHGMSQGKNLKMVVFSTFVFFLSCFFCPVELKVHCKDLKNNAVDWFIMYKMPELTDSSHSNIREGYGYFYMDSNNMQWQLGEHFLNESNHALYYTLQQIYEHKESDDISFLFYNDETPEKHVSYTHGHTKGVVGFDKQSGFWLVHSLPRFPEYTSYAYPPSGREYGQTFLCISMDYSQFDLIGMQLLFTYPQIFEYHLPTSFGIDNPNIALVVQEKHVKQAPWNNTVELSSSAGIKFLSFAKFTDFNADIYAAWLAPYFGSMMFTETWQNGRGKSPSNCSAPYKVENIQRLTIQSEKFKETKDHSKWGVTRDKQWICIGGINRMEEQKQRAGGMVCTNMSQVWRAFNESISLVETCSSEACSEKQVPSINVI